MKLSRRTAPRAIAAPSGPERGAPVDLVVQRDRLTERFALMQSELGGLFYEMAIRDHVRMDVLIEKAAALQIVEAQLGQVEYLIREGAPAGGQCPACGAPHARAAAFCAQCAAPLEAA